MAEYMLVFIVGIIAGVLSGFGALVYVINRRCSPETRDAIRRECGP